MGRYINESEPEVVLQAIVSAHTNNFKIVRHRRKRVNDARWVIILGVILVYGELVNEDIFRAIVEERIKGAGLNPIGSEPRLNGTHPEEMLLVEAEVGLD